MFHRMQQSQRPPEGLFPMGENLPQCPSDVGRASGWFVGGFLFCAILTGALVLASVMAYQRERRTDESQ